MSEPIIKLKDLNYARLDLNKLISNDDLLLVPFSLKKQSVTIGASNKMDIVLDPKSFFNSKTQIKECSCISGNHACVFYDKETNMYELLNYSEYGTVVDSFCYGLDFENSDEENQEEETVFGCKCRENFLVTHSENSALLNHGSMMSIGCLNFLFIILDVNNSRENENETIIKSLTEYQEKYKNLNDKKTREKDLIKFKWKSKEKGRTHKKELLFSASKINQFKIKNDNKRALFD
jgi:hypothetical protein